MRLSILAGVTATAVLLSAGLTAHATTLYYTFTGTEVGGTVDTLTFSTSSTGPYLATSSNYFTTEPDTVTFDGGTDSRTQTFRPDLLFSSDTDLDTAFDGDEFSLAFIGDLYSGSTTSPTLLTGTFTLDASATALIVGNTFDYTSGTLVVSTTPFATSVTPEPSSFLLLGTGLLSVLGVVRRHRSAFQP